MGPAFVGGATGYTGAAVVRALTRAGVETVAHVRPDSPRLSEWHARFTDLGAQIDTTAWSPTPMNQSLERLQPSLVFALLGTTAHRARSARKQGEDASYETVDYGMNAMLLQAAVSCGSRPRFLYLSSLNVSASSRSPYFSVRWRLEQEVQESGLPWTIVRPSFITGPDREESRPGERLAAQASDLALHTLGLLGARRVRDRYRSTDATELAGAITRLALDASGAGRIVHPESLRS